VASARLNVRVTPGAKRDEVVGWREHVLRVRVRAAPEKGRANDAVCALIASALSVPARAVTVGRGHTSRDKVLTVEELTEDEVRRRLGAAML
jgi:uncharacterized protein (TIGR00251 family)